MAPPGGELKPCLRSNPIFPFVSSSPTSATANQSRSVESAALTFSRLAHFAERVCAATRESSVSLAPPLQRPLRFVVWEVQPRVTFQQEAASRGLTADLCLTNTHTEFRVENQGEKKSEFCRSSKTVVVFSVSQL